MIKAKVVSFTYSKSVDGIPKFDLETYLEDLENPVVWDGPDAVIMTKEEYESLRKRLNEKEGEICKLIVNNDIEQLRLKEKIRKLEEENEAIQKDIKDLEEKLAHEADEVDLCPDGTIVFRTKKVSELKKKVKKLEEENKALKEDKFTMKITGGLFYKED